MPHVKKAWAVSGLLVTGTRAPRVSSRTSAVALRTWRPGAQVSFMEAQSPSG